MRRKQGVRWKESIGGGRYSELDWVRGLSIAVEMLLDAVCGIVFVCAARLMLADVFGWMGPGSGMLRLLCLILVLVSAVMEVADHTKRSTGWLVRLGVLLAGVIALSRFCRSGENGADILSGLQRMLSVYVDSWNVYYGTSLNFYGGQLKDIEIALEAATLVTAFAGMWTAKLVRSNLVMAVFPLVVFALELLVGYSPQEKGLFLMFGAILLSNASRWKLPEFRPAPGRNGSRKGSVFAWLPAAVCVVLLCAVVRSVGGGSAQEVISHSEQLKAFVEQIGLRLEDLSFQSGDSRVEELNNKPPQFLNVPVLTVTLTGRPEGTLYLKGYYAGQYDSGDWVADPEAFNAACIEAGFDSQEMSANIASLGLKGLLATYHLEQLGGSSLSENMSIIYEPAVDARAYFPYFAEVQNSGIRTEGDSRYIRSVTLNQLSFPVWEQETVYDSSILLVGFRTEQDWELWYEEYVLEHYRDVPEGMTHVQQIAAGIDSGEMVGSGFHSSYTENRIRLSKAKLVAEWMAQNTSYDLNPPRLPAGEDPIEYFLGTSRTGYCMHYASASVMLLREMGVPARIAVGYMVTPDEFYWKGGNGILENKAQISLGYYQATVLDNQAHAWVEIYLEGVGWVPVEVTATHPAFIGESGPDETTGAEPETGEQDTTESGEETAGEEETTGEETTESSSEETAESDPEESSRDSGETLPGGNGENPGGISPETVRRAVWIVGIILVLSVAVYAVIRLKNDYRVQLHREIRKRRTSHAIRMINRRIYRKLRYTGRILKSDLRDDGYEAVLKKTYSDISAEDWERYMEIVKTAAFSKRELPLEDMEFCYGIYRKISPRE